MKCRKSGVTARRGCRFSEELSHSPGIIEPGVQAVRTVLRDAVCGDASDSSRENAGRSAAAVDVFCRLRRQRAVSSDPSYEIFIVCDNDLLTAVPHHAQLEGRNLISRYDLNTCIASDREGRRPRLPEKAEPGFSVLRDGRVLAGVFAEVAGRFTMGEGFPDHGKSYERENRLYPCAGERSRDFNRVQGD